MDEALNIGKGGERKTTMKRVRGASSIKKRHAGEKLPSL